MKRAAALFAFVLLPPVVFAQNPATGLPPFGSFEVGPFDILNRQNLNVHFAIPIVSTPGRGLNFNFAIPYDSLVWQKSGSAWTTASGLGWNKFIGTGSTSFVSASLKCKVLNPDGTFGWEFYTEYSGYSYQDPAGTLHSFDLDFALNATDCGPDTGPRTGYATDISGYYMDATSPSHPVLYALGGNVPGNTLLTDTNGNQISQSVVGTTEVDWIDSANHTALKAITSGTSVLYQYYDTTGTLQTITLKQQSYSIKTNFACAGVVEYTGTITLPYEIDLPNGQMYQFAYEPTPNNAGYYTGRVKRVTLPTGGYYEYQYPTTGNMGIVCADATVNDLTRVMSDGTNTASWHFTRSQSGTNWNTTVMAPALPYDTAQNSSVFTFNSSGQEITEKFYQGSTTLLRTVNVTWATNGTPASRVTIAENNQQMQTTTSYDTNGNLLSISEYDWGSGVVGPLLRTMTYTYLSLSAYTSRNIINRVTQKIIKDGLNVVKSRTDIAYDEAAYTNSPCVTGASQHDDTNYGCTFTVRGNPTTVTTYTDAATPAGPIIKHSTYDSLGNLRQADLDCCQKKVWNYSIATQYAYPDSEVCGAAGGPQTTTSKTYNSYNGLIATATDENNKVTTNTYDILKRLIDVARPDGSHVTYSYDETAHTKTENNPIQGTDQRRVRTYMDGLGRRIKSATLDAAGATYSIVETQYDPFGRSYKVSNPHNSTPQYWTEHRFDALGRSVKVIFPDNSQIVTTYSGNATTVTDPAGKQRKSEIDELGRTKNVYEPDIANGNALAQLTSYSYTVLGALAGVSQGVQTRTFNYDGVGRLTSETTPEGGTVSYQYNSFGLKTQRTDARNVITTYGYDTLNRLTSTSYNVGSTGVPATASVTLTYGTSSTQNNNGRLLTMTDGVGSETYAYDVLGRRTQVQKVISGTTYTTSYQYNLAGEVTQTTDPSTRVVQQAYDAIGRLCAIGNSGATCSSGTTFASGFAYNPAQQVAGFNYGNGVTATLGYSADRLQLTSISYAKGAQTLFSLSYGYTQPGGNNGQIASITDNVDNGRSVTYSYDALSRISSAVSTGSTGYTKWGLSWTYDRYGNRTTQTQSFDAPPSNSLSFANPGGAQTNRPDGYVHDASGDMTNDGANTMTYDAENRVLTATGASYTYDGNSLRVKKVSGTTTTVYVFSGTKVIAEYDNGAAPLVPSREYIYSGAQLLATLEGGTTKYHHADHLSVRLTTDTSGAILGQQGHFPYGESWYASGTTTKWQFTSYERDAESGNDYAVARTYINRLGRFSSPDPVEALADRNPQAHNHYAYVTDDPLNRTDPSGMLPILFEVANTGWDDLDCMVFSFHALGDFSLCGGGGGGGGEGGGGDWVWELCRREVFVPCMDAVQRRDADCRVLAAGYCGFRFAICQGICIVAPQFCAPCLIAAAAACTSAHFHCERVLAVDTSACYAKLFKCVSRGGP